MIDKEVLLEVKRNLEKQAADYALKIKDTLHEKKQLAEGYDRVIEKTTRDQNHNELLLTLVNDELRAMEEVEKVKLEPWREALANKALDDFHQAHQPWRKEMDGLTDHMKKDKEYSFEEFEDQVLDRYKVGMERVNASEKCESYTPKHYLLMDDLEKEYEYKQSAFKHPEIMERVNASARRAEEKESGEALAKDKARDRSFASFLAKYWLGNNEDEEGTAEVSVNTLTKIQEKPSDDMVTTEDKNVSKKSNGYDSVTAKIKEGKELDPKEINSLFKPCYEIECAIVDILTKHKTLKLKDIVYFVEQRELDFESKHIYGYVQSVLNRSERFKKVSYGNWCLNKDDGETGETKPDSNKEVESIDESTVLSVVRPKWNGVISYVDKLGVVNKIEQK